MTSMLKNALQPQLINLQIEDLEDRMRALKSRIASMSFMSYHIHNQEALLSMMLETRNDLKKVALFFEKQAENVAAHGGGSYSAEESPVALA